MADSLFARIRVNCYRYTSRLDPATPPFERRRTTAANDHPQFDPVE